MYRTLERMSQMLENLHGILEKAEEHASENGVDLDELAQARLIEDMFPLVRQIQACTDTLKFACARLTGTTDSMPVFLDEETTFPQLHERLNKGIEYFATFAPSDFEGAEERHITLPFAKEMYALGEDYLHGFVVPNFYFHVTTAYGILRSQGVPVGKRDYIGGMTLHPKGA